MLIRGSISVNLPSPSINARSIAYNMAASSQNENACVKRAGCVNLNRDELMVASDREP
jgi:hypothetical protein